MQLNAMVDDEPQLMPEVHCISANRMECCQLLCNGVTTRQVVLLDLSSFSGSAESEVTVLVRSDLRDEVLPTYTSQRCLAQSFR